MPAIMAPSTMKRKHIVIVGGGAAGMSCAATLANHPDRFKVTLLEKGDVVGGQATSIPLDEDKYGASWMNNGVQGGTKIFKHTINFFNQQNYPPQEVQLQVSFGKGPQGFWTNVFPSKLVSQHSSDIKSFGTFLSVIKWTMPILGLVPIGIMLRLFFSKDFGDKMLIPLIALFLGTGNQTASVPSAIVERLFDDPNMKLWDYDSSTLLPNLPTMITFDNLAEFYRTWKADLESKGVVIRTGVEVEQVLYRSSDQIKLSVKTPSSPSPGQVTHEQNTTEETYDSLVLCTLADESLRILGTTATWREKFVLGGAAFYDDVTITHTDQNYFNKHYETHFNPDLCADPTNEAQAKQISFAKGQNTFPSSPSSTTGFRPMYYTYTYDSRPKLIEMSFNCSNYQHQLRAAQQDDDNDGDEGKAVQVQPVYQTIFLDNNQRHLWTMDDIDENKIIKKNWWHQLGHRWQHYLRVVPGMMFLQGKNNTLFAGSWTLVNMHEIAAISGIAAAYHLGAEYKQFDPFATNFFKKYLLLSHGMLFHRQEKKRKGRSGSG